MTFSNLFLASSFFALMPTLPLYMRNVFGFDNSQIGMVIAVFSIAGLLVRPFAGYLLDSLPRFAVFMTAFVLISALYGAYALAGGMIGLICVRLLHGGTWATVTTATSTMVVDILPVQRRGEGIGIFALAFPLATAIGPVIGLAIMAQWGSTVLFVALSLISFVGLGVGVMTRGAPSPEKPRPFRIADLLLKKALPVSITMLFLTFPYGGALVFASLYAAEKDLGSSGPFFVVFSVCLILARVLFGRGFDRGQIRGPVVGAMALFAAGLFWLSFVGNAWQFAMAGGMIGFGFGIIMPLLQTMANSVAKPNERGAANSTFFISFDLGIGVGSYITGFWAKQTSLENVYLFSWSFIVLGLAVFLLWAYPYWRRLRPQVG
ncbi:MAG: MFS transporter [Candidatus Lernaella stagnicola]|nr:MFS transporter [Candidatus Lernaella stagnicola]